MPEDVEWAGSGIDWLGWVWGVWVSESVPESSLFEVVVSLGQFC